MTATILRLPAAHQALARARMLILRLIAETEPTKREHPGGMFAERKDDAA